MRNNFSDFDNRDVWEEGKKTLEKRRKRRKRIRNLSVVTFIASAVLIVFVFLRPDYFTLFSFSKISNYISHLFPLQQETLPHFTTQDTEPSRVKKDNATYPDYQFTKEQVDKVKRKLLDQHKGTEPSSAYMQKLIDKNREREYRYEIELLSGKRIYGESAKMNKNIISFESTNGLIVALDINEIKNIQLIKKPVKEEK